jgi:hypothetical protein
MSRFSGFIPINFRLAGKLLFIAGVIGLVLAGADSLSSMFSIPSLIIYLSLAAILAGLYMIFLGPKEE